jgi:hypothetical protein
LASLSHRTSKHNRELPYAVFELASSLMPDLLRTFEQCDLSPTELFILTHIRHAGRNYRDNLKAFPKKELRTILLTAFRQSPPQVTKDIQELMTRELLDEKVLKREVKQELFGSQDGYSRVYVLTPAGSEKIDEFIGMINGLFGSLAADMSGTTFKGLTIGLDVFARRAIRRIAG